MQDLPRFLVLLLAFQRSTIDNWGYNLDLDSINVPIDVPTANQPTTLRMSNGVKTSSGTRLYANRWGLTGRCTRVVRAYILPTSSDTSKDLANTKAVEKIYWPNLKRLNEEDIIARAQTEDDVREHLPRVFGSYDGYSTAAIRQELGIMDTAKAPFRRLRVLVFEHLEPITKLQGQAFVRAWLQCVRCESVVLYVMFDRVLSLDSRPLSSLAERGPTPRPQRFESHAPDD